MFEMFGRDRSMKKKGYVWVHKDDLRDFIYVLKLVTSPDTKIHTEKLIEYFENILKENEANDAPGI